jgi:hypothetical protein
MSMMGSSYFQDSEPVAMGYEDDAWYRGAATASGAGIGAGIGAFGGPAGMAVGSALGGWVGSLFEPDAPDLVYETPPPEAIPYYDEELPELPGTSYLKNIAQFGPNDQAAAGYRSLAEKYGVRNPYGFRQS